jgi:hypothetical protein
MVKNTRVPEGTEFETRGDRVAKKAAKKAESDRILANTYVPYSGPAATLTRRATFEDAIKDQDLIKKYGGTNAMKSKSFATKRYMNGGMVMSGRGVRDTKMS